jgi:colicin import membrane protein
MQSTVPTPSWSKPRGRLWPAVLVSVTLHGSALAAYAFWPAPTKPAINLDQAAIKARLVKLGKPRDEALLPRMDAPQPPNAAQQKPSINVDNAKPAPTDQPKPSAADILNKLKNEREKPTLNELIERRLGEPTDEGQKDGDVDGVALDGQMVDTYFGRVAAKIQRATQVSSVLSDDERIRLRAVVCFQIDDQGALSEVKLGQSSSSTVYDNDVLAAAKRASPVPAPPPGVREQARKTNCLTFCPTTCR